MAIIDFFEGDIFSHIFFFGRQEEEEEEAAEPIHPAHC